MNAKAAIQLDACQFAKEVMLQESEAVRRASELLDDQFRWAVDRLSTLSGNVIVSGVGKSGLIRKNYRNSLEHWHTKPLHAPDRSRVWGPGSRRNK